MYCDVEEGLGKGAPNGPPGLQDCCPVCRSHALYSFCDSRDARRTFLCVVCGTQIVVWSMDEFEAPKRECPECGGIMEPYCGYPKGIHFRCSKYPSCRTYMKAPEESR